MMTYRNGQFLHPGSHPSVGVRMSTLRCLHVLGLIRTTVWYAVVFCLSSSGCAGRVSEKQQAQARIRYDMGIAAFQKGEMRSALGELLQAVQQDDYLWQAHNALGLVFHAMGHNDDALKHYRRAVQLKPTFSEAYNNMGTLLTDMKRYDEAIKAFQTALGDILYATPSLAEGNMGWAYYKKGDVTLAWRHLSNAIAVNPKFCRGYTWLAQIGVEIGKPDEVLKNGKRFDKYCVQDAANASMVPSEAVDQMNYYLGRGYLLKGDRKGARERFSRCANHDMDAGGYGAECALALQDL